MEKKETKLKKGEKLTDQDRERLDILAKTEQSNSERLLITPTGVEIEDTFKKLLSSVESLDDPEKKYNLYYKGISKLLKANLPKGKDHKWIRDFIYEEKNTYLTRGHRKRKDGTRGLDSRMTYISDADDFLKVVMNWVINGKNSVHLFDSLVVLNKSKGYGVPDYN